MAWNGSSQEIFVSWGLETQTYTVLPMENMTTLPQNSSLAPSETSVDSPHQGWATLDIFCIIIFGIIFIMGTAGNMLVIWVAGFRMPRTVNTVWFVNLAIADFAFCLSLPLNMAFVILHRNWPFGRALCKLHGAMNNLNLFASVFLVSLFSVDRCVTILWPLWARKHRRPQLAALGAMGAWIMALAFCSTSLIIKDTITYQGITYCYNNYDIWNETHGNHELWKKIAIPRYHALIIIRSVCGFVGPMVVIVVCYGLISAKLWQNQLASSGRPFRVLMAVVVAFFLCWLPFHVLQWVEFISSLKNHQVLYTIVQRLGAVVTSLAFLNSCLNPVLYVFIGRDFREQLLHSLPVAVERALAEEPQNEGHPCCRLQECKVSLDPASTPSPCVAKFRRL
ncbi:N-formyl peptide receptor 2-like [Trichosurus vulpecula]|uniref:N-formyl peptide receptor 2-like n=1 Tax=Trichosurus vulpecula TaxID=9337 RepID=UPI00186AC6F9|nr:N-formyl peptide receptor 2-like [Trichosurus vulpecula]